MRALTLAALFSLAFASAATAARITITPGTALIDVPVGIRVTGLPPERGIILRAATVDRYGNRWSSRLGYRSDRSGVVDTHSNMRLFWSMQPARRLPFAEQSFSAPEAPTPVEVTALIGGRRVASARLLRSRRTSDLTLTKTTLPNEGFIGTYAARPSHASTPAVLIVAGSLPGHDPALAEQLASSGFPALAIGYWGEPGLPPSLQNIPLEYFATALRWLAKQPGVDPRRIVALGISRGGEAALLLGVSFPELVHGTITCSGGDRNFGGVPDGAAWTLGGKPLPLAPIAVEKISGPVLAFAGGKDEVWSAAAYARSIADRARTRGKTNVVARIYPGAGHGAGCLLPNVPLSGTIQVGPSTYAPLGGTPAANEASAASSWPLLLHFLATL